MQDESKDMPYKKTSQLPKRVKNNLPNHAQSIYKEAFNSAWGQYSNRAQEERESVAHRVAWSAVKQVYERDGSGEWHKKD